MAEWNLVKVRFSEGTFTTHMACGTFRWARQITVESGCPILPLTFGTRNALGDDLVPRLQGSELVPPLSPTGAME